MSLARWALGSGFNDSNNDNQSHNYALTIVTFAVFEASEILAVSPDHSVI
jgi:hypothetical protein